MTEKRFNLISDNNLQLYDFIEDNGKVIHTTKVVDLLNEFADEIEQLKKALVELKEALVELKEIGDYQEGRIKELSDENEHLEKQLSHIQYRFFEYRNKVGKK